MQQPQKEKNFFQHIFFRGSFEAFVWQTDLVQCIDIFQIHWYFSVWCSQCVTFLLLENVLPKIKVTIQSNVIKSKPCVNSNNYCYSTNLSTRIFFNQGISLDANLVQLYLMIVRLLSRDAFIQWHREISISKLLNQHEMPNFTSIMYRDSSINKEINAKEKWNAVSNLLTAIFLSLLVLYATVILFRNFFASPYQDSCLIALAVYQFRAFYWINVEICWALPTQMSRCGIPAGLSIRKTKLMHWRVQVKALKEMPCRYY